MAFFGDGAANEGAFHEALNLAAIWRCPWCLCARTISTDFPPITAAPCSWRTSPTAPAAYGMPGVTADGMDVDAVYRTAGEAVERPRSGGGPTLLEYKTYRFMGHSRFEASNYRTKEEVAQWKEMDPLPRFREQLLGGFTTPESRLTAIEDGIARELEAAVRFAETSPDPNPQDYRQYIFSDNGNGEAASCRFMGSGRARPDQNNAAGCRVSRVPVQDHRPGIAAGAGRRDGARRAGRATGRGYRRLRRIIPGD